MPSWLAPAAYVTVSIAAFVLLVLHTIGVAGVQVDTTTIGLLAVLLLVPLAPYIRRLSAGGVVAEIGTTEARRLQASASELPPAAKKKDAEQSAETLIQELVDRDPPLGLAQLRIELEKELRRLYALHIRDAKQPAPSLGIMASELQKQEILPREIADPLADVVALANRAVHGEYVPTEVASDISEVGLRVLAALRQMA